MPAPTTAIQLPVPIWVHLTYQTAFVDDAGFRREWRYIKRSVKYKVHDENNSCKVGDRVQIIECRPLSKDKRWSLKQIIESIS